MNFKKSESISKAFYQRFVEKVKNESVATFLDVYDVFASKFVISELRNVFQSYSAFKNKKGNVS